MDDLTLVDWRVRVADLYAAVRADDDPERAHTRWRRGRDALFREHPDSPLPARDPLRETGLPYWPYDPDWRLTADIEGAADDEDRVLETADTGALTMRLAGRVVLPSGEGLDVWRLVQYGGGLFVPLKDGTAGRGSYGAGRYVLDTAKGAWLGTVDGSPTGDVVLDLNFAYHPSCRYDDRWRCPLAAPGNTITTAVRAGERLP